MMRVFRSVCFALAAGGLLLWPGSAAAQAPPDAPALQAQIDQLKKEFGDRIAALEAQLAAVQAAPPQQAAPVAEPAQMNQAAASKVFNPDIAAIGNFLGAAGHNEVDPSKALEMRESEVSLQAIIDPYAKADFFLAFGEEGVELEEGYATFTSLPGALQAKVGKM